MDRMIAGIITLRGAGPPQPFMVATSMKHKEPFILVILKYAMRILGFDSNFCLYFCQDLIFFALVGRNNVKGHCIFEAIVSKIP